MRFGLATILVVMLMPSDAAAQTAHPGGIRPEVFGSVAWESLSRFDDNDVGGSGSFGAGAGIRVARLGLELDVNRSIGLTPARSTCGIVPCVGAPREGVLSTTVASGNVLYYFHPGARVQPYVVGGLGAFRSHTVHTQIVANGNQATLNEFDSRDTGMSIGFGAGLRIALNEHLAIRTDMRNYNGVVHSRENLSLLRSSVGVAWTW